MHGIRVLDLSRVLAGPWASQQLSDQGATVLKIEPPSGDETRNFGPIVQGESTYFLSANRNKRSLCLDLKTKAGQGVLQRLIARADVVLENFRPGVAKRLGFDWEILHKQHPLLVCVSIKAFGTTGAAEWTRRPGYDLVLQAMGGAVGFTGFPEGSPSKCGLSIADTLTGMLAVQAALTGLLHRERCGEGQRIEINMMQAQAAALSYHATRFTVTGEEEQRRGNAHHGLAPYNIYSCRDGLFALACGNDQIWTRVVSTLELEDREEWNTNIGRTRNREAVDFAVAQRLKNLSIVEADKLCAQANIPAGPVQNIEQALNHPAVEMVTVDHPVLGVVKMPGPFFRSAHTPAKHSPPPLFNQHRDELLLENDFQRDEILGLEEAGAFGS